MLCFRMISSKNSLSSLWSRQTIRTLGANLGGDSQLTQIDVNEVGIATLSMNNPPVNILNLEMMQSLNEAIKDVKNNKCRGLILTSTSKTVFCGGLDIKEMYKPDIERLKVLWTAFQDSWLALYGCEMPTVALINGHSPAGGCVFATCCEYRVMLPNFTIGLNETQFGLVAPKFGRISFNNVLPQRITETALNEGKMFSSEEALKVGLVDELAPSKELGHERCVKFIEKFAKVDAEARAYSKQMAREEGLNYMYTEREKDLEHFLWYMLKDRTQERLGAYLRKLQKNE